MKMLVIVGTALLGTAMFQLPATPPMKMGLWESTVSTKMTGMDLPQGMNIPGLGNRTTTVRTCMTPESYAKNLAANQQKDCVRSNEVWTGKSYAFDLSCRSGKMTGHFEMFFDGMESGHGTTHMTMNPGTAHPMQVDATTTMHYIGSDCGKVTPDKPDIVR